VNETIYFVSDSVFEEQLDYSSVFKLLKLEVNLADVEVFLEDRDGRELFQGENRANHRGCFHKYHN
jgi:hypothetical protein